MASSDEDRENQTPVAKKEDGSRQAVKKRVTALRPDHFRNIIAQINSVERKTRKRGRMCFRIFEFENSRARTVTNCARADQVEISSWISRMLSRSSVRDGGDRRINSTDLQDGFLILIG